MPTGYTAGVVDGTVTEFRDFALLCARAFGATIMQRDDPMHDPPKHRVPSDWNAKALAAAEARLADVTAYTLAQAEAAAEADYARQMESYRETIARRAEENARIDTMLTQVEAWEPPTAAHSGMKDFMREQLAISRSTYIPERPKRLSGEEWLAQADKAARREIGYHAKAHAEELARCAQSNAWIDALYRSVEPAAAEAQ